MTRFDRRQSTSLVLGVLLLGAAAALADEKPKDIDRTPKSCIMVQSIARDEAASDRIVLFFMRGKAKEIYRNDLKQTCAFLKKGETELDYHYQTQSVKLTRLCDYDGITVHTANSITCALGPFTPITADEASALLGRPVGADAPEPAKSGGNKK